MAPPALVCYTAEKSYKKAKLVAPIFLKHRRGAELSEVCEARLVDDDDE